MSNIAQLKKACLERAEECYRIAEEHYGREFTRTPIVFNARLTSTGGRAHYKRCPFTGSITNTKLDLSTPILQLNGQAFIDEVPGHEVAHHVADELHNRCCKHDYRWGQVMRLFGQPANRTHKLKTPQKANNSVESECGCSLDTRPISKAKANKILRGALYTCRACRQPVRIKGQAAPKINLEEVNVEQVLGRMAERKRQQAPAKKKGGVPLSQQVRDVIKNNPEANIEELIILVSVYVKDLKPGLRRKYVEGNISRVRG